MISNYLTIPSDNHDIYHFNNSTKDNPQNRLISNPMIPPQLLQRADDLQVQLKSIG
jgi:hypothetical protein